MSYEIERPRGYYFCIAIILLPIIIILTIPLLTYGITQLPYALLMIAVVVVPFLGCGLNLRGRPLFQFSYHGTPFVEEVMNIQDDEKVV